MKKYFRKSKNLLIVCFSLFFIACNQGPSTPTNEDPESASGLKMTNDWKDYNTNNEPQLTFLSFSKKYSKSQKKPEEYTKIFSSDDKYVKIHSRFSNLSGNPKYEIKIYEPNGRLFDSWKKIYQHSTGKWNLTKTLVLNQTSSIFLPGIWNVEIYLDGFLITTQQFELKSNQTLQQQKLKYSKILFLPIAEAKESKRKHSKWLNFYTHGLVLAADNSVQTIPSVISSQTINIPNVKYYNFDDFISNSIKNNEFFYAQTIKKYNPDIIITGRAKDTAMIGEEKEIELYIINTKTKKIDKVKATHSTFSKYHNANSGKVRQELYKKVGDKLLVHLRK